MFVIGFQEIVPLTAQQIVQADPEKRYGKHLSKYSVTDIDCRRVWEGKIMDALSRRPEKRNDYVLLRSHQVC